MRRFFAVLLATTLVTLLSVITTTSSARAGASCPNYAFLGVRGSGQSSGYGPQVYRALRLVANQQGGNPGDGTLDEYAISYPADPVTLIAQPGGLASYFAGMHLGEVALEARMRSIASDVDYCGAYERFILAGYSQGAEIVHRVLAKLAAAHDPLIDKVQTALLIADPARAFGSEQRFGSADRLPTGIATYVPSLSAPDLPPSLARKVAQICMRDDIVCNPSPVALEGVLEAFGGCSACAIPAAVPIAVGVRTHEGTYQDPNYAPMAQAVQAVAPGAQDLQVRSLTARVAGRTVTYTVRITASAGGLQLASGAFACYDPVALSLGALQARGASGLLFSASNRISGTAQDGTYRQSVTLPSGSAWGPVGGKCFTQFIQVLGEDQVSIKTYGKISGGSPLSKPPFSFPFNGSFNIPLA